MGYANQTNEYSNRTQFRGTSPQAPLESVEGIMWTSEKGGREENVNLRTPELHLHIFSTLSGHVLKESSANVAQFMAGQMLVLSWFTPGDS